MSLEKAIIYKKEKRKQYRGSAAFDCTCRNHGSCSFCTSNRTIFDTKARMRTHGQEDEWFGYWWYPDPGDADSDHAEKFDKERGLDSYEL
jgi:hypothetical protein